MDIGVQQEDSAQGYVASGRASGVASRGRSAIGAWVRANGFVALLVAWITIFGFSLRVENPDWDEGQHLHPDERFLMIVTSEVRAPDGPGQYFNTDESPLNPYQNQGSFVYGTFPLFLNKTVAEWMDKDADGSTHMTAAPVKWTLSTFFGYDVERADGAYKFDGGYSSQVIGRVLSAIFDTLTILLVFELARILYGRTVGLLAAALYSVAVLSIQYSHFFGSETFLIFFVTATIYFSVRIWKYGGGWNYLFAGLALGLALATKLSAAPVLLVPAIAILMRMWPPVDALYRWAFGAEAPWRARGDRAPALSWPQLITPAIRGIGILVAAGIAFRIAQPYAFDSTSFFDVFRWDLNLKEDVLSFSAMRHLEFLKPGHYFALSEQYRKDIGGLIQQQKGSDFPPNVQWVNRTPYLFPLQGMFYWGLGIPLALAAAGGTAYSGWRLWRHRDGRALLLLFWIIFQFWFVARGFTPTIRYFLPIYPALAILAAFGLVSLWKFAATERARSLAHGRLAHLSRVAPVAMRAVVAALVIGAFLWGLAFVRVYREDISRVQATHWIYENVPLGSRITSNEWDDGLPLRLAGQPGEYEGVSLKPYVPDYAENKVQELVAGLDRADYVVESSNRLYDSIPRLPARYPNTVLYYKYLFDGTLGFEKVAEFTNYPGLFGIEIPDQSAEESFTVYDHPKVTIWKKTDAFTPERALALLEPERAATAIQVTPGEAGQNAILFRPEILEKQAGGGTWSDIFDPGSITNDHPLLSWLLTIQIAALALAPLAIMVFRGLPDRGYLLTKPLGVLGLSYLVYAPSGHGLTDFTRTTIALALALMVATGAATAYLWRTELRAFISERWRFVLLCEAVFLVMFLFSYWLRIQNPDLYHPFNGGEKPMDFAYFNGVLRTTDLTQGPIDPWYSGGYLNYYWWGFFIAATPTKLLGVVPEVAYNLVVPMFFALSAAAAFSVAYNLAEGTRRLMRRRPNRTPIGATGPVIAALLAIFLVLIAGNLRAVDVLERNFSAASPWHSGIPLIGTLVVVAGGFWDAAFGDTSFRQLVYSYDWWAPSRALTVIDPAEVTPITEFPFWTFLFADLHAHLMAIPFALTAVGVSLGVALNFTRLNPVRRLRSAQINSWVMVALVGLIVGALRWINSWDYPVFMLMGAAAILIGELGASRRITLRAIAMGIAKVGVMVVLAHYVLFSVVKDNYSSAYGSVQRSAQTTDLSDFLSHFGVFLFLIFGFGTFMLSRVIARDRIFRIALFGPRRRRPIDALPVLMALLVAGAAVTALGTQERWGVFWLSAMGIIAIAICALRELRRPSPLAPVMLFVYTMTGLGLGLTGGVEYYTLTGDIGRMNTVFKFYLHVWQLWGIVAAYAAWLIIDVMRPHQALMRRAGRMGAWSRVPRYAFAGGAVALLALTLVYPYFGTRARVHDRVTGWPGAVPATSASNNGLDYLERVSVYDNGNKHELKYTRDAITWVRENIEGTPTTIEAVGPSYRSLGSRIAINTGLPTVAGWEFHQVQQRGKFAPTVQARHKDVNEFYTTEEIAGALEIIKKYGVEWVIVGDEEAFNYPAEGLAKFQNGLGGLLELAYENPAIRIFHVIPDDELTDASASAR